ncbi:alpha-L-fucosidase [Asticcacaulis sp. EMRT-3]|uniref:alpha-L-fucosidase n=1 Tax=Asticcacaulis sp. EMRT-3 TaxID=3040349 RepID=UPI0024AEB1D7|nr:alpha-L-fucosidase [Asticcacaulis sp. EMRT-3]MDI7775702.1 alpha-L-fucosidase [Asticcacaulis sp. EMRT-3]
MRVSRRGLLGAGAATGLMAGTTARAKTERFTGTWDSLAAGYQTPDWFRDAKLGIWAHWGPQCIPEWGDWYGRQMYQQGNRFYDHHVATYGHPAQFGFMQFLKDWKIDQWDPDRLMGLYKKAGAKYFMALAGHHDNFDMFDSQYQAWNITKLGPKVDTMAGWAKAARAQGLKFGVSNHMAHAWHWWQTAYGYDPEGAVRGLRYDAYRLKKADGQGQWWDGFDPQELYTGPHGDMVAPDGIDSIKAMDAYTDAHSGQWLETVPPHDPYYVKKWLARSNDLIDKYQPDLVYYDDTGLPLEQAGLDATAYYYNQGLKWHGKPDVIATGKKLSDLQRHAMTEDVERGFSDHLRPIPWQTDTCIGNWHYDRPLYERNGYKTAKDVIQRLIDVVSKNGNLLLSIPVRGNGAIDDKEEKILAEMADWMAVNGDAIFATRPWEIYGEGPFHPVEGAMNEGDVKPFTYEDIRFTTKEGILYVLGQAWPDSGYMVITAMAQGSPQRKGSIGRIELLGHGQPLDFELGLGGLTVKLPDARPAFTPVLKIMGTGLVA